MRRLFFFGSAAVIFFAACVGNDPASTASDDSSANDGGFDSTTSGGDGAAPTDGSSSDAPVATTCDPAKAFGIAVPLDALNGTNDSAFLRLSSDGLSAYYAALSADGSTSTDLFQASRGSLTADFSAPVDIDYYPGSSLAAPSITSDGLSIYYSYFHAGSGFPAAVELLTRPNTGERFPGSGPLVGVGAPVDIFGDGGFLAFNTDPFIRQDGTELYFSSDRLANGKFDIFRAVSEGDGGFASAALLSELGTSHANRAPVVTPDGLNLYFATDVRADGGVETNWTIYRASRATTMDMFGNITRVDELALDQDSYPNFITTDLCTIYFHRIAVGGSVTSLLYKATKTP